MMKALELGYDSTFSEVENALDGLEAESQSRRSRADGLLTPFLRQVRKHYGVVAVVVILRMRSDPEAEKTFLTGGRDV